MQHIPAGEFKAKCLKLMDEVQSTQHPIVITKRGVPVAKLEPVTQVQDESYFGLLQGTATIHGDIVSPIDEAWDAQS